MSKKSLTFTINLVPEDPFYSTPLGKILKWALSVGRYIVIFTEMIVILSFVSRFSLDRQVTDLNDSIFQKETIIKSYGDLEANVRTIQKKIDSIKQIEQQAEIIDVFPELSRITPTGIKLKLLVVNGEGITMTGITTSQQPLTTLINNIQLTPTFSKVSVTNISTSSEEKNSLEFIIDADLAN